MGHSESLRGLGVTRMVVVLFGPAGAGKTTAARASGLDVFDRDDAQWSGEKDFTRALAGLAGDLDARAVVIRSGATSSARTKAVRLVGATHAFVVLAEPRECIKRVQRRGRSDKRFGVASVGRWFDLFDRGDGVTDFPGWDAVGVSLAPVVSREW